MDDRDAHHVTDTSECYVRDRMGGFQGRTGLVHCIQPNVLPADAVARWDPDEASNARLSRFAGYDMRMMARIKPEGSPQRKSHSRHADNFVCR